MSEKQWKWKQISQPTTKLNRLISRSKQLPEHFVPSKNRASSVVDKTFQLQRSQLYSNSVEKSALNLSRDEDSVEKFRIGRNKQIKQNKVEQAGEIQALKLEIKRLSTLHMRGRQSSLPDDSLKKVSELKKQFVTFKQNILKELERQKNLVNQMIKDVLATLQFELEKLRGKEISIPTEMVKQEENKTNRIDMKNFQQLRQSLNNNDKPSIQKKSSVKIIPEKVNQKKENNSCMSSQPSLPVPNPELDLAGFVTSMERLKSQINQMDNLLSGIEESSSLKRPK